MTRRLLLPCVLIALTGLSAQAQGLHSRSTVPTRSALERVGLERNWSVAVPLGYSGERLLGISMAGHGRNELQPANVYHAPAAPGRFISNSDLSPNDDFYVGATLEFTGGAMKGTARDITGYV